MKIFMHILKVVGLLFVLIFLAIIALGTRHGATLACKNADERMNDLEAAVKRYETAKSRGDKDIVLIDREREVKDAGRSLDLAQTSCANQRSSLRRGYLLGGLIGFLGVTMAGTGFIFGRRKRS